MGKNYSGGVVSFTITGPATVSIPASISIATNANVIGNDEGEFYDRTLSLAGFAPVATITTKNLAAVRDIIGLAGQCVGTGLAVTQVDLFYRRTSDCQTTLGSTPHIRDRVTTGLLVLSSRDSSRGQDSTITFTLYALSDGTNAPISRTDGVALPTTISAAQYTMGLPMIAGVEYPEVESYSVNYGNNVDTDPAIGLIWPTVAAVRSVRPVITFRGRDLSKIGSAFVAAGFDNPTHADTLLQDIKRINAGTFESFASAVHFAETAAGMLVPDDLVNISANQRGTHTLRLQTSYDGTNAPIVVDTTSAYDSSPGS